MSRSGIRIGNYLVEHVGARPWLFGAKEYSTWNRRFGERYARLDPKTIAGKIPEAVWDSELRGVMQEYGRPIYEEMVLDELMGDLGSDR